MKEREKIHSTLLYNTTTYIKLRGEIQYDNCTYDVVVVMIHKSTLLSTNQERKDLRELVEEEAATTKAKRQEGDSLRTKARQGNDFGSVLGNHLVHRPRRLQE